MMTFLLSKPFGCIYHPRTSIPSRSYKVIYNGIDPNNNLDIQSSFHLEIPINYQSLTNVIDLIHTDRFFDAIIIDTMPSPLH